MPYVSYTRCAWELDKFTDTKARIGNAKAEKVTPHDEHQSPNATFFAKLNSLQRKPQRIRRQRNRAYPHAEAFLVVTVDLRSYKITFLTAGVFNG